jgi:hypothetical protein
MELRKVRELRKKADESVAGKMPEEPPAVKPANSN